MTCTNRFGCHMRDILRIPFFPFNSPFVPVSRIFVILNSSSFHFSICVWFRCCAYGFCSLTAALCLCVCVIQANFMAHSFYVCRFVWLLFDVGCFGCTHMVYGFQLDCTQKPWNKITCYVSKLNYCQFFDAVKTSNTHTHTYTTIKDSVSWVKWPKC